MTPKQILDSFSETLMRDERILSPQERSLITNLLQHARAATGTSAETQEAVTRVIAGAIGETVAQRAFAVLGGSIVDRILQGSAFPQSDSASTRPAEFMAGPKQPQTPGTAPTKQPQTPGISPTKQPQTPGISPTKQPQTPGTSPIAPAGQPQSPGGLVSTKVVSGSTVAAAERPERLAANCVILDEFLAPQELAELTRFTLEHEAEFQRSEVISASAEKGVIDYDYRRSRVLMDLGQHQEAMLARIKSVLPQVLQKLGMEEFTIRDVEAQITASNDGDFFQFHSDNGSAPVTSRHLTFVYFFHREPRQFDGGELRIHDARLQDGVYVSEGTYQTIVPQQNQIVFFPCELLHEITPVECASHRFADSRFTLNGWLRQ
ncbi:MAG TPA: 2OG-Fe(II) oxygenase [Dongiaceae bacterium]|nr:2OG-Fe(II) oxygenase [Dongiaceae bacterium]